MANRSEPKASKRLSMRVDDLPGIGKGRAAALRRLDIYTVTDLLRHTPMRYEKEAAEGIIADLPTDGKTVGSARGQVVACRWVPSMGYGKKGRFEATLRDDSDQVGGRTLMLVWFNAGYLREKIMPGLMLRVQGKAKMFGDYPQMVSAKWEVLDEVDAPEASTERLRPVYPATERFSSVKIEQLLDTVLPWALPMVTDPLPEDLLQHHNMPALAEALRMMHRPEDLDEPKAARRRLAFNELLLLQLGIAMRAAEVERMFVAPALNHSEAIDQHIRSRFPFELTDTQSAAVLEIAKDLSQDKPMNRMLQGDVGAGKTVVALYAMLMAVADRKQAALMAPTELLAEQHHLSISRTLEGSNVRVALLTGNQRDDLDAVASGEADLVVGTHALLSESVKFNDLAVVVIDEQHRFGVMQRATLRQSAEADEKGRERMPHTLVMTATPIPRTLSLTLLGDLDNTTLTGLPPGRTPIQNRVVGPEQADEVYRYMRTRLERGEQAYVVVPAIDAAGGSGGGSGENAKTLKSVNALAKTLQQKFLDGYTVGTVHGRLKRETRQKVMEKFREGEIDVLVATTVIEVGVDVPNATVMVIEHAERFGLAQLHQLRGRVGRGDHGRRSLCVFIAEPTTDDALSRMDAIASTNDGFKVAELDLQIRGMGEILGTKQSGLPPMKQARIPEDIELLQLAKRDARGIVADDPELRAAEHANLRKVLMLQYGSALGLVDVG
ncbi:ATP-dependent DNA helicase RecG [Algisphaera agarilytica]|uniref:Probable DNA 3'-5' helicase RecG n=1 Tax=Algisphaera agarilytica TaxID=1385975 RepID=A0A7X0LMP0_9BACT|nr:ATP-dependent DNA helicase RecG [Algisphaera agarilytica]MBB6431223.1 ATP-dependent DNA helicase RecG [Algisphaera agarilytica]